MKRLKYCSFLEYIVMKRILIKLKLILDGSSVLYLYPRMMQTMISNSFYSESGTTLMLHLFQVKNKEILPLISKYLNDSLLEKVERMSPFFIIFSAWYFPEWILQADLSFCSDRIIMLPLSGGQQRWVKVKVLVFVYLFKDLTVIIKNNKYNENRLCPNHLKHCIN